MLDLVVYISNMATQAKMNTDYKALLSGLTMLKCMVDDILTGDPELKTDIISFYNGFRLAADGFIEASYGASTQHHKDLIKRELEKYIKEVETLSKSEVDNNIIKFPFGSSNT